MSKKMPKKEQRMKLFKRIITGLVIVLFAILLIAVLLPREEDIIKGVTYDLKYPGIRHYSQIPRKVYEEDFRSIKEAGINTIRIYGVPPEFILDLADAYEIDVIETIVFPGDWTDFDSPYQLQALKREAVRNIRRDRDRECIVAWSIWNDAPWTYGTGKGDVIRAYGRDTVNDFLRELYMTVKKHDPLRPVTAATLTVNEEAMSLGTDFLDILGYNVYLGVTDWTTGAYDPATAEETVAELEALAAQHEKPVVITETGYSTFWDTHNQGSVIKDQIAKVDRKLKGIILFQWADDWSKAGTAEIQNEDVEEHWGIMTGKREPKPGYAAAQEMFKNSFFAGLMYGIADYFKGTYYAVRKRALRKKWEERPVVDKEIEDLQNELNLKPRSAAVPDILKRLSRLFFDKHAFNQFSAFLREYKAAYEDSPYKGLVDYYRALAGWTKLEFLAAGGKWELYFAEKARELDAIRKALKSAREKTMGTSHYLKPLYLSWLIHNDLLDGKESAALQELQQGIKDYAVRTGDFEPYLVYARSLSRQGETQIAEKLVKQFATDVKTAMDMDAASLRLKRVADAFLDEGRLSYAHILYNAYVNLAVRNYSEEDASFVVMEVADLFRRHGLYGEAEELYTRLTRDFSSSELADDAAYAKGVLLKETRSYSKAIKAFHDFIVEFPESELVKSAIKETLSVFTVYGKGTRESKTITFLREIIALYPESDFSAMARFELASSLESLGRKEEARIEYQYIIDHFPESEYAGYAQRSINYLN